MTKTKLLMAMVSISLLILVGAGCTSRYAFDMKGQRQTAIEQDAPLLKQKGAQTLSKALTLDDVIQIGLKNNLDLKVREITEAIGDDKAFAAKLKMLPQLNASETLSSRSKYEVKDYQDELTGAKGTSTSYSDDKHKELTSLTLSWNVLDFGLSYIRAKQEAATAEIKKIERIRQGQLLTMKLVSAYWRAQIAENNLGEVIKTEKTLNDYRDSMQKLLTLRQIDPDIMSEIEKKQVRLGLTATELQGEAEESKIILANLMGLSPAVKFTLQKDDISAYIERLPDPFKVDPAALELIAFKSRPELFVSDMELAIQQDEARGLLISMFPGLRFDLSVNHDTDKFLHESTWNMAAANIALDILSLPSKIATYNSQDKSIALAKTKRLLMSAGITTQLHISLHSYAMEKKKSDYRVRLYEIQDQINKNGEIKQRAGELSASEMSNRALENIVIKLEMDRALANLIDAYSMLSVTIGVDYKNWRDAYPAESIGKFQTPIQEEAIKAAPASEPVKHKASSAPAAEDMKSDIKWYRTFDNVQKP